MKKVFIILIIALIYTHAAPPESICSGNISKETPKEVKCKNLYYVWDESIEQARLVYAEPLKQGELCIIDDKTYWTYKVCDDNGLIRNKYEIKKKSKEKGKFKRIKLTK